MKRIFLLISLIVGTTYLPKAQTVINYTFDNTGNRIARGTVGTSMLPQWAATGNTRCIKNAIKQNIGFQQKEERDNNASSVTYNQLRWTTVGYDTNACPLKTYYNVAKSQFFTKSDCNTGYDGDPIKYTVAAETYSSTITQADADQKAQNDINANGQNYANTNGTCHVTSRLIVTSCTYKKVLINGLYQWRYEIVRKNCWGDGRLDYYDTYYSTTSVPVESCSVPL